MGWIVFGVLLAVIGWGILSYNGLVALRVQIRNAFSQIDVQLQRRYDLIPNLVETAKAYMKHERETLEAVIAARNQAQAAARGASADPADADAVRQLAGAETALGGALSRFFALAEAYPDLKASTTMLALQEELSSTENRVAFARQAYNDGVAAYNIKREQFPDALVAGWFGFKPAEQWQLESSEARTPVRVKFD